MIPETNYSRESRLRSSNVPKTLPALLAGAQILANSNVGVTSSTDAMVQILAFVMIQSCTSS